MKNEDQAKERRAGERTADLKAVNLQLQREVAERKQAEEALRKSEAELKQRVHQQQVLLDIGSSVQKMTKSTDLEQVAQACMDGVKHIGLDVQAMAIHRIIDPDRKTVETYRVGQAGSIVVSQRRRATELVECWQTRTVLYHRNLLKEASSNLITVAELERFLKDKFGSLPIRCLLNMPFSQGVISAHSTRPNAFSESDIEILKQVAEIFSVGISRLEDLEQLEERSRDLIRLERLRALGEMSAGVSHNLNNILTGILGPAQLLKMHTDDREILEYVEDIFTSGLRAQDLVKRLHYAVKGEEEPLHPVRIREVVREAVRTTKPRWKDEMEARGRSIEVIEELEEASPVQATRSGLYDTLVNLLFNAVDAMPEGGTITIRTQEMEKEILLTFQDTGIGMDEETCRRVFDPFFTTKMDVGSGLGLSTAYGTITRWRGSIEVESLPGEGTTFTLRLPIWKGVEMPEEAEDIEVRQGRSGNLLVVDDDETVCNLLYHLLGKEHRVETALTGHEALEAFSSRDYDAALIDLGMSGMPGDRVAQEMKRVDPSVATVLITGWKLEADDPRISAFDIWIQKPFNDIDTVWDAVARAIELHDNRADESGIGDRP